MTVCDDLCHVETAGSPQSFQASADRTEQFRERTRVDQPTNEGPARKDHSFRSNSSWQEVPHSGAVLQLVHRSLGGINKGGTSRVPSLLPHVHRTHGEVQGDASTQVEDRPISGDTIAQSQGCKQDAPWPSTGQWQILPSEDRGGVPQRFRVVRGSGGLSTIGPYGSNGQPDESSRAEHAGSHEQHRRCPDPDCEPVATAGTATEQSSMSVMTQSEYQELKQSCENYQDFLNSFDQDIPEYLAKTTENPLIAEMNDYIWSQRHRIPKNPSSKYDLLEIYCSSESQLTKEAIRLGKRAIRFGLNQGDLSNFDGRKKLYECLIKYQPRDVWMSPSCKAWCRWNQFNASKSPEAARKVMNARDHETIHVWLCDAMCQYQIDRQRHFHLEQPGGSDMLYQAEMENILHQTYRATCDQCTAGNLKHPTSLLPLKKNMQILTTSQIMARRIDSWKCSRDHPHDHVAGSFADVNGQRRPVSQFTELYTATFARRVCRALMASQAVKETSQHHMAFVEDISKKDDQASKRRRLEVKQNRPTAFEPEPARPNPSDSPVAATRTDSVEGSSSPGEHPSNPRSVMEEALEIAPKVFKSHKIRVVELCKGADRLRKPPIRLAPHEASHRATVGMHRVTKAIFSKDWENWETLKGRNLTAKTQPARLLITVFGSPVDTHLKMIQEKRAREDTSSEPCTKKPRIEGEIDPIGPPEPG